MVSCRRRFAKLVVGQLDLRDYFRACVIFYAELCSFFENQGGTDLETLEPFHCLKFYGRKISSENFIHELLELEQGEIELSP